MRNLCVLLIALVVTGPFALAQGATDEYAALVSLCGKPASVHDKAAPNGGPHAAERDVRYRKLEFLFLKNDRERNWSLTGAFHIPGDDTITRSEAAAVMPCVGKFASWDTLFMDDESAAPTPAPAPAALPEKDSNGGLYFFWCLVALVVAAMLYGSWQKQQAWNNRPKRLCMNCKAIQQPLQMKTKEWYCPVCQHKSPVPLDSPAAVAHLGGHS